MEQIHEPEANISAAARYISELNASFGDVPSSERTYFILAAYNGGGYHVRDAMALTRKNGRNPYRWADVSHFLLLLRDPQYYNDPVVKNGYMRSNETFDYVERIRIRYAQYRGVPVGSLPATAAAAPHRYCLSRQRRNTVSTFNDVYTPFLHDVSPLSCLLNVRYIFRRE